MLLETKHKKHHTHSQTHQFRWRKKQEVKLNQKEKKYFKWEPISNIQLPPVTSHICVMADSSVGTLPSCSGSAAAAPGKRSTRANSLWSQRNGSLVSSLPGKGEFKGRWSWSKKIEEHLQGFDKPSKNIISKLICNSAKDSILLSTNL